jgi:hypothetical protein
MITGLLFSLPPRVRTPANDDVRLDNTVPTSRKRIAALDKAALASLERRQATPDTDPNKVSLAAIITLSQGASS